MSDILTPEQKFERTLLASLMRKKEVFSKVMSILQPKFFTGERKEVFSLIKKHYQEFSTPATEVEVEMTLKNIQNQEFRNRVFDELQGIASTQIPENSESFVDKMASETLKFAKDALYLEALEIGSEGLLMKDDSLKLKAEKILDERAKLNIDSDLGIEFSDSTSIIDYYDRNEKGILTQHYSLNERLGMGFLPGTLSVILAPSGVGKSLLMTDLVSGWVKDGKNVLMVSLEMSQEEVMKRVHSNTLDIPIEDFQPRHFDRQSFVRKLNEARAKGCGVFYSKDYPTQSFSALQLESLCESFKNEKNLTFDIILVDYLGIMKSDLVTPSVGLYSYVKSIAEETRAIAKKLNVPVISANQLNRAATNQTNADNANVSDSYGTVMTADLMIFLLQTEEMKASGDIIAKITKNRFTGKTDTFPMRVDYSVMRFEDPEIPKSIEARKKLKEQFDFNVKETEKLLEEHYRIDNEIAKAKDSKIEKEPTFEEILGML